MTTKSSLKHWRNRTQPPPSPTRVQNSKNNKLITRCRVIARFQNFTNGVCHDTEIVVSLIVNPKMALDVPVQCSLKPTLFSVFLAEIV